ncbi:probable 2-ketogluconate reductase isoform X1 [Egretta garzetta]|nr:probable 2-ketogluconate reductase isoform X1 [Egretta garzetta]
MFRSKAFGLLKPIPLMSGQPNLACKFMHRAIGSHGHRCHRRIVDYGQRDKTYPGSAGGQTVSTPQTKIMAEEELPGVLILDIGGTHGVLENLAALLKKHFHLITMKEFLENKKEMSKKIQSVFVFEGRPTIDRELLENLPNLKVIGNSGVGVDHLDLKMISNFGVKVTNTPHAVADPTADIGMALMLASARRLVEGCQIAVSPDTKYFAVDWLGVEVTRTTLGIIGMGNIGYRVAQRARAFNMRILYHNRNRRRKEEEEAVGAHYCEKMEDLLQQSDFVMLVVNLTPETHKLIGKKELGLMKPTATLINISRGAAIDQDALVEALQNKVIRAAALDVTYPEPLPRDHPLLQLNNIIITPHIGTATVQAICLMAEEAIANMLAALNGQPIPSEVFPK